MKIAVVGGGITGLASAEYAMRAGAEVTLFEARPNIGGTLRDYTSSNGAYFCSCQYLSEASDWLKMFPNSNLYSFAHSYGSYTDIFGSETYSNEFAGPVCEKKIKLEKFDINLNETFISISDRLKIYPTFVKLRLAEWLYQIGLNVDKLHHSALIGFQMSRIFLAGSVDQVISMRSENSWLSNFFGLPKKTLNLEQLGAILPAEGYNDFFDQYMTQCSYPIKLKSIVRPFWQNEELYLHTKDSENLTFDKIIWTSNPSLLINNKTSVVLDSINFQAKILAGDLNDRVDAPFYIQVFSNKSNILRIFIYNIGGKGRYTIETAKSKETFEDTLNFASNIISHFTNKKIVSLSTSRNQNRFFAYSVNDHKTLTEFIKKTKSTNLILSDFISFGRDDKINKLINHMNNLNI